MKKSAKYLVILVIIAAISTMFVACNKNKLNLSTPTGFAMNGDVLGWTSVENAEGYEVVEGSKDAVTTENPYIQLELTELRTYEVKVRAFAKNNGETVYSDWGSYSFTKTNQLSMPKVTIDGMVASWTSVENAGSYQVKVVNTSGTVLYEEQVTALSYSFDETQVADENKKYTAIGRYTITVIAKPNSDSTAYVQSQVGSAVYCVQKQLEAPVVSGVTTTSVKWGSVGGASSYKVSLYYVQENGEDILVGTYNASSSSYSLSYFDFKTNGAGKYYCKVQAIGDSGDNRVYLDSEIGERVEDFDLIVLPTIDASNIRLDKTVRDKTKVIITVEEIGKLSSFSVTLNTATATGSGALASLEKTIKISDGTINYVSAAGTTYVPNKTYYSKVAAHYERAFRFESDNTYYTKEGDIYTEYTGTTFEAGVEYYTYVEESYIEVFGTPDYIEVTADELFNANYVYYIKDGENYVACPGITAFTDNVTYYTKKDTDFKASNFGDGSNLYYVDSAVFEVVLDDLFYVKDSDGGYTFKKSDDTYYGKLFSITVSAVGTENRVVASKSIDIEDKYLSYKVPAKVDPSIQYETAKNKFGCTNATEYDAFVQEYDGYYVVETAGELQYLNVNPDGNYILLNDLDFKSYEWTPIKIFSGTLEGNNHSISNLVYCDNSDEEQSLAFIVSNVGNINDLFLMNVKTNIISNRKGIIAGLAITNGGKINNCFVEGAVSNIDEAAGLVYQNYTSGIISNCQSFVTVNAVSKAGGVAVINEGSITNTYSVKDVTANNGYIKIGDYDALKAKYEADTDTEIFVIKDKDYVSIGTYDEGKYVVDEKYYDAYYYLTKDAVAGGLVAVAQSGSSINYSYALGSVSAKAKDIALAGGLVGHNFGSITNSFAGKKYSNDTTKRSEVVAEGSESNTAAGGLIGKLEGGSVNSCYSTNRTTATNNFGGFVGYITNGVEIKNSYSTGGVSSQSATNKGAFIGYADSCGLDNNYFYNNFTNQEYNNVDKYNVQKVNSLDELYTKLESAGTYAQNKANNYSEPVLLNMAYTTETEKQQGSGANLGVPSYVIEKDGENFKITNMWESKDDCKVITIGDNTKKGTIVVVLDYNGLRTAVVVTVK